MDVQLGVDVAHVGAHGVPGHHQLLLDDGAGASASQKGQHLPLARGRLVAAGYGGATLVDGGGFAWCVGPWAFGGFSRGAALPGTIFQENIGSQPFMKVNRNGVRFCNESTPYDILCFQAGRQPGGVFCQVIDANAPEDILRFATIGCSAFANQMMAVGMPIEEFCTVALEQGVMQKADTLDELADKLGFEGAAKQAFLDQADRYNAQFDAQADDEFGKEAYRLSALRQAPFYGCWFGGSLLATIDGLQINADCQVLREDESIIPGLYAAGDVSGSFFSGNYPEYIVGCASGRLSTEGRHVARLLAGDLKA